MSGDYFRQLAKRSWQTRVIGLDYFGMADFVPEPTADVPLALALEYGRMDVQLASWLLDLSPPADVVLRIYENHAAWMRFMALRMPDEGQRFAEAAARMEAKLVQWSGKRWLH